jgi:2-dehydro-3-deoxyphosphooctonate aldolase (KDO 8-P synthase)
VRVGSCTLANERPLTFIGGPCSLESPELVHQIGGALKAMFKRLGAGFILKCSYDKANRSSLSSYRGIGVREGLRALDAVRRSLGVPLLVDVHEPEQAEWAAEAADVLQIPAFLCRQTDLLLACGRTGKPVNIKKGQFLSPWEMANAVEKVASTGNRRVILTERGTSFGYRNLVVDMRSLEIMKELGCPVVYDATHSVQLPGALGHATGGQREFVAPLSRAAAAVGVAAIFFETHPDPDRALSDGPNSLRLKDAESLARQLMAIDRTVKKGARA